MHVFINPKAWKINSARIFLNWRWKMKNTIIMACVWGDQRALSGLITSRSRWPSITMVTRVIPVRLSLTGQALTRRQTREERTAIRQGDFSASGSCGVQALILYQSLLHIITAFSCNSGRASRLCLNLLGRCCVLMAVAQWRY